MTETEPDDFLDGCDLDFAAESSDVDPALWALFPDGAASAHLAPVWHELFGGPDAP